MRQFSPTEENFWPVRREAPLFHPMSQPERQHPAPGVLLQEDGPTLVFLTVHVARRDRWLAREDCHRWLLESWQEANSWRIGHYVILPGHLHLFCTPVKLELSIEQWITFWKCRFVKRHRHADWKWQSRGWHHRLRTTESYEEKLHCVRQNPVRAGLVEKPEDWPFQGKLHDLIWRE